MTITNRKEQVKPKKFTTYVNCSYWITSKIAERLRKGTLVELNGRIFVDAYIDMNSQAKASLKCHVNNIKIHSSSKEVDVTGTPVTTNTSTDDKADDMPF